jgi:hypothetical protein
MNAGDYNQRVELKITRKVTTKSYKEANPELKKTL